MLFPGGAHVFGPDSWGVLIDYEAMGWVDDADAASIDYDDLLAEMQEGTRAEAEERREMGLDGIELDPTAVRAPRSPRGAVGSVPPLPADPSRRAGPRGAPVHGPGR